MADMLLALKFKGERDYVHASDVFNLLEGFFSVMGGEVMTLSFTRFTRQKLVVFFEPPSAGGFVAKGAFSDSKGQSRSFWLVESDFSVEERYAFEEARITQRSVLQEDVVELQGMEHYSLIEHVIALTKYLNYSLSPDVDGKWVFGQLKLKRAMPKSAGLLRIIRQNVVANRFSVNQIEVDGQPVGEIRFVVGKR